MLFKIKTSNHSTEEDAHFHEISNEITSFEVTKRSYMGLVDSSFSSHSDDEDSFEDSRKREELREQGGPLASELARHPVVLKVDDWLYCHGGLFPYHVESLTRESGSKVYPSLKG